MIESYGPDTIAAFVAEPVAGATLGAAVPCEDYWPKIVEVCRRYGVLVIADEVMTGFGRTGPMVRRRPLGRHGPTSSRPARARRAATCRSGSRRATRRDLRGGRPEGVRPRVHVVAQRARRRGRARDAAAPARRRPGRPRARPRREAPGRPRGGARRTSLGRGRRPRARDDARDRAGRRPRHEGAVPAVRSRSPSGSLPPARDAGLLLYSSTGHVDGADGDLLMLGPPFVLTDDDAATLVERTVAAIRAVA